MCWVNTRLPRGAGTCHDYITCVVRITHPSKQKPPVLQVIPTGGKNTSSYLFIYVYFSFRQGVWLRGGLHLQHQLADWHGSLVRGWVHFHHVAAAHAAGRGPGVCADTQGCRGAGAAPPAPAQRQAHEADADGRGAACGALPQPHHSRQGEGLG